MNEEFLQMDRIEKYINKEMKGGELTAFKQELKTDESLQEEVSLFQDMLTSVELLGDELTEKELSSVQDELKEEGFFKKHTIQQIQKPEVRVISIFRKLAIAASILVLLTVATYLLLPNNTVDLDSAYAQYYSPEKTNLLIILDELESLGMTDTEKSRKAALAEALAFYENGDYTASFSKLEAYLEIYSNDSMARLYLGLSAMELKDYSSAIQELSPLQSLDNFDYKDMVDWYLALSYSQATNTTQKDKAIPLLKKIANDTNSSFAANAKKILEMIE